MGDARRVVHYRPQNGGRAAQQTFLAVVDMGGGVDGERCHSAGNLCRFNPIKVAVSKLYQEPRVVSHPCSSEVRLPKTN